MNEPIRRTLADAVEFLEQQGIKYALVDGLAASIRGQSRVIADVDMVLDNTAAQRPRHVAVGAAHRINPNN